MPGEIQRSAHAGVYPATNFGAFDRRFGTNFPDDAVKLAASNQEVYFPFVMPPSYAGGNLTVELFWDSTQTTGSAVLGASIAAETPADAQSTLTKGLGTEATQTTAVNGTASGPNKTTVTVTSLDSVAAGDKVTLRVRRLSSGDSMAGTLNLTHVRVSWA